MRQVENGSAVMSCRVCRCAVHQEYDLKSAHKRRASGSLTTQVGHHATHHHLLDSLRMEHLLQPGLIECIVLGFWQNSVCKRQKARCNFTQRVLLADQLTPPTPHVPGILGSVQVTGTYHRPVAGMIRPGQSFQARQNGKRARDESVRSGIQKILLHVQDQQSRDFGLENLPPVPAHSLYIQDKFTRPVWDILQGVISLLHPWDSNTPWQG